MAIERVARAKVNLALHVTGRRADGYHLLDSLVAFADVGDLLTVAPAESLQLRVSGPFARDVPTGDDNLVLRAARSFGVTAGAEIELRKNLPVASGIGGGSADAAACLAALAEFWKRPLPDLRAQLALGADVPVCMSAQTARMRGIGEDLTKVRMPPLFAVLANSGSPVATAEVFRTLSRRDNPPLAPLPADAEAAAWLDWLAGCRNDLEEPATRVSPSVSDVLTALRRSAGCRLARMTGSGGTCFGLYPSRAEAQAAATDLARQHPGWWLIPCTLG